MIEDWPLKLQHNFDSLPEEKKKEQIGKDEVQAHIMELFVSPEDIVPGIKVDANKDKVYRCEVGEDYTTPFAGSVLAAFDNDLKKNNGQKFELVKKLFKNLPIVDLGAGTTERGLEIAKMLEASGYIGVEPYTCADLGANLLKNKGRRKYPEKIEKPNNIPFSVVPEDALTFLKKLPDHSVGIISIGTDTYVFYGGKESWVTSGDTAGEKEHKQRVSEYIQECKKEIARVLHPQSALLAVHSVFELIDQNDDLIESQEESILATKENDYYGFSIIKSKSK